MRVKGQKKYISVSDTRCIHAQRGFVLLSPVNTVALASTVLSDKVGVVFEYNVGNGRSHDQKGDT